jgi:twinkle protein
MRSSLADYVVIKARAGQRRVECPECAPTRKTKGEATLSIKDEGDKVMWNCWHCQVSGAASTNKPIRREAVSQPQTVVPLRTLPSRELDVSSIEYLATRGISEAVVRHAGVVSGDKFFRKLGSEAPALGFVYRHKDQDYAIKWRSISGKEFTQDGSAQTLYLADKVEVTKNLIITEGELDALSFWEVGLRVAVSIPSGAIEASNSDDGAKLKWMQHHDAMLAAANRVFLAVDMDGPGQTTANELARRIGKAKCWRVEFPAGCKDANDTLVKLGADALTEAFASAQPWPIEGIAAPIDYADKVTSLYTKGLPRGMSTGWPAVDDIYTLNPGNLVVITGTPGHGKSTFIDAMLVNAMKLHNWRVAYASFENPPDIHLSKLIAQKVGKPFGLGPNPRMDETEMLEALGWVNERVTFLTHDGVMPTVQSLIERFETAVRRYGVKACVVDPFNFLKLNTKKDGGVDTESINEMLSEFKMFAQRAELVLFLVAHPAKPMGGSNDQVPGGYSISGSAHFYNRADFGLTMHRKDGASNLHVWKCRFAHQGTLGSATLTYDAATGGYNEQSTPVDTRFAPGSRTWLNDLDDKEMEVPF